VIERTIVAGFGGQGILTLGKLMAEVGLESGLHVTYFPSYGTEVRGGTANCHVVLSDGEIYSPLVDEPTSLVILNQPSYDRFIGSLAEGGLAVVNSTMVERIDTSNGRETVALPATAAAAEIGDVRVANMMLLGALVERRGVVDPALVERYLKRTLGERHPELLEFDLEALARGAELASAERA
jgi:2-oxoglutarate ferredoxin oxidoreductase subunit gamma